VATNEPAPAVAPYGTVNTQMKPPPAVVVIDAPAVPELQLLTVTAIPSNASVTCEDEPNPDPVTVTLLPRSPLVGERGEIVQAVTVYAAPSLCPEKASVATTVVAPPGAPPGMAMVHTNPPAPVGVMVDPDNVPELHDDGVTATAPTDSVTVDPDAVENAEPVTVTVLPTRPLAGETVIRAGSNEFVPVTEPTPATTALADTTYV